MKQLSPYEKICFRPQKPFKLSPGYYQMVGEWKKHEGRAVGIDPGVNFGLTIIENESVVVRWGKLPATKIKGLYALAAHKLMFTAFDNFTKWQGTPAVVEGAAYDARFGQVGLEEVRIGFYIGLWQCGFKVLIVPPKTIRKNVFGDGRMQAMDIWPSINHNGADSIAIALEACRA